MKRAARSFELHPFVPVHGVRLPFVPFRLIIATHHQNDLLQAAYSRSLFVSINRLRFVKYIVVILLCGAGIGGAIYRYLPTWVFCLFVLINFMGWAIVYGSSRHTGHDEDEL